MLVLAAVWLGPLPERAVHSFAAHMTMHMGVVAVAAPLLAFGVAGGRYDPVCKIPALFAPIPASLGELVVVWVWHAPALHHAARHSPLGLAVEQALFLLGGLCVWLSAFGGDLRQRGNRTAAGVVGLLLTSMHMTLLGALLALAPRPLFTHSDEWSGLTPLEDQHLGGAIMLLVGGVSYLLGGLWLTGRLLRWSSGSNNSFVIPPKKEPTLGSCHWESPRGQCTQHLRRNSGGVPGRRASESWHPGKSSPGLWAHPLDSGSRPAALPGMTGCQKCRIQVEYCVSEQLTKWS
jgi:putative membrane protein